MALDNPFPVNHYAGAKYFCDRDKESNTLLSALQNKRNVLLYAPRRYGKTGLIQHVFAKARRAGYRTLFTDALSANSLNDFNNLLLEALSLELYANNNNFLSKISEVFKRLRPVVEFDPMTGQPSVSISKGDDTQETHSLTEIFNILRDQKEHYFIAIDEFQQILSFKNQKVEALIRTEIQRSKNLSFIFSGSQRHLLLPMFNDAKRPFFGSTDFLKLDKIDQKTYARFIQKLFEKAQRSIAPEQAQLILGWTNTHTYYTQVACNRLFGTGERKISNKNLQAVFQSIVREQDAIMASMRLMLNASPNQWHLLKAISKEGKVDRITGRQFLQTHQLASSAAMVASIKALEEKELVYVDSLTEDGRPIYEVYNPFFANWFKFR